MKQPTTLFRVQAILLLAALLLTGCDRGPADRIQGYVEGEYVYVAAPVAGQLDKLSVARGTVVKQGNALFALDDMPETAARDQAQAQVNQALADLEDAKKGKRPSEIESIQAQLDQARASLDFANDEFSRDQRLIKANAVAQRDFDLARSNRDQALQRVAQLEADLKTAQLGDRPDQITAAEAELHLRQAALAQAEWNLAQKHQTAPQDAIVFDTLYQQGEYVPATKPVVELLPPANIKVRAFVPETLIGSFHLGEAVKVTVDGVATPFAGKISFISPQAEYTPPVIYSEQSREKLSFMIEAEFPPSVAARLHPGQPVDLVGGRK